jgi:hypothetical protein
MCISLYPRQAYIYGPHCKADELRSCARTVIRGGCEKEKAVDGADGLSYIDAHPAVRDACQMESEETSLRIRACDHECIAMRQVDVVCTITVPASPLHRCLETAPVAKTRLFLQGSISVAKHLPQLRLFRA